MPLVRSGPPWSANSAPARGRFCALPHGLPRISITAHEIWFPTANSEHGETDVRLVIHVSDRSLKAPSQMRILVVLPARPSEAATARQVALLIATCPYSVLVARDGFWVTATHAELIRSELCLVLEPLGRRGTAPVEMRVGVWLPARVRKTTAKRFILPKGVDRRLGILPADTFAFCVRHTFKD